LSARSAEELLTAIRSLPATREVVHCHVSFRVPVFTTYAECPKCGSELKVRSFSSELEVEDVFATVFDWMSSPAVNESARDRIGQLNER
jgi:hypothetical protein